MYRATASLNTPQFGEVKKAVNTLPKLVQRGVNRQIMPFARRFVQDRLMIDPGPVVYADDGRLRWQSEKQRRYVIGYVLEKDAWGNIIPYVRTGATAAAWEVALITTRNEGAIRVENPLRHSPFVYGEWQQNFHQDTGWPRARLVLEDLETAIRPMMDDIWYGVTRAYKNYDKFVATGRI